jgi:hypothetical protein
VSRKAIKSTTHVDIHAHIFVTLLIYVFFQSFSIHCPFLSSQISIVGTSIVPTTFSTISYIFSSGTFSPSIQSFQSFQGIGSGMFGSISASKSSVVGVYQSSPSK